MKIIILQIFLLLLIFINSHSYGKTITGKARIIDGDTIHIDKKKIRLHAIDAPEKNQNCILDTKEWSCGKKSTIELKKLISNKIVRCKVNDIDIYNRFVAVCFIDGIDINRWMVKNGWAIAYRYYSSDYIIDEKFAKENKLGIWSGKFLEPYIYRKKNK